MLVDIKYIKRDDIEIIKSKRFLYGIVFDSGIAHPIMSNNNISLDVDIEDDDNDNVDITRIGIPTQLDPLQQYVIIDRIMESVNKDNSIYVEEFCYNIPNTSEYIVYAIRFSGWKLGKFYRRIYSILPNCSRIYNALTKSDDKDISLSLFDLSFTNDEEETYSDFNINLSPIVYSNTWIADVINVSSASVREHIYDIINNYVEQPDDNIYINYIKRICNELYKDSFLRNQTRTLRYIKPKSLYILPNIKIDTIIENSVTYLEFLDLFQNIMASFIDIELFVRDPSNTTIQVHYYENKYSQLSINRINEHENIELLKTLLENILHLYCILECRELHEVSSVRLIKTDSEEMYVYLTVNGQVVLYYYDICALTLHCSGLLNY